MHKKFGDFLIHCIHFPQVASQTVYEETQRPITGIELYCFYHILLHGVRSAIVANYAERFVRAKETIGAGESLDNILILQHLIHIERIDPLGIKACEHLIYYD